MEHVRGSEADGRVSTSSGDAQVGTRGAADAKGVSVVEYEFAPVREAPVAVTPTDAMVPPGVDGAVRFRTSKCRRGDRQDNDPAFGNYRR